MCFSATASFATSAVLIPVGIYALKNYKEIEPKYLAFACIPLLFGIQQLIEGLVWQYINSGNSGATHCSGIGFLFFSYLLWLVWTPMASWLIEPKPARKKAFFVLTIIGALAGISIYLPLLFKPELLEISVIQDSISYKYNFFFIYGYIPKDILRLGYAAIILLPLLFSSFKPLRHYGVLITISAVVTYLFFEYAFASVWCFFAAALSVYILYQVFKLPKKNEA